MLGILRPCKFRSEAAVTDNDDSKLDLEIAKMEETWRSYNREEHRISNTVPTSRYDLKLELELREIEWNCPELRGIGRKLNALETLQVQDL